MAFTEAQREAHRKRIHQEELMRTLALLKRNNFGRPTEDPEADRRDQAIKALRKTRGSCMMPNRVNLSSKP